MNIAIPYKKEGEKIERKTISSSDIVFHQGMPKSNDKIYDSWKSETLTQKIIKSDADNMFFDLFDQEEKYSCYIIDKLIGKTMALSGTSEYYRHFKRVSEVSEKILTNPKTCANVKLMATLHMMSLMKSSAAINELKIKGTYRQVFHNTGLLVDDSYRGYDVYDETTGETMTVGTYIHLKKKAFLTHPSMDNILCTNANNRQSSYIFMESMGIIHATPYSLYDIPHDGGFATFIAVLKAPKMKEEIQKALMG